MSFRKEKAKARLALHHRMQVTALLYEDGPNGPSSLAYPRVNSKIDAAGDLQGTSLAYAESVEVQPKLIFLRAEHVPKKKSVYSISDVEAYRVDHLEPADTITVTAICVALSREEAAQYDPPEEC